MSFLWSSWVQAADSFIVKDIKITGLQRVSTGTVLNYLPVQVGEEVGSNSTSYAQNDVELSKNLNSKVYSVVLDAIKNEQRFGGSLAGSRQG